MLIIVWSYAPCNYFDYKTNAQIQLTVGLHSSIYVNWDRHKTFFTKSQNGNSLHERHVVGACYHNTGILGQVVTTAKFIGTHAFVEVIVQDVSKLIFVNTGLFRYRRWHLQNCIRIKIE